MFSIFILMPLFRKRSMVLMKILDAIQIVAYFKYINAFINYRVDFLYLDMRAVTPWNEGLQVLTVTNDFTIPVFTTEETHINKLVRIFGIWLGVIILTLLVGIVKNCCGDGRVEISLFMSKNIRNALAIAFYLTLQDLSFLSANIFLTMNLSNYIGIGLFALACILMILTLFIFEWHF